MKSIRPGSLSGCVVWVIVFCFLSTCVLPVSVIIGGLTSTSRFSREILGSMLCPDGTSAEFYTYATTTTDEYGNSQPSTAYELHCVDEDGMILKKDPVLYAILWIGLIAGIGLGVTALLGFALAAPAGVLISGLFNRDQKPDNLSAIELL